MTVRRRNRFTSGLRPEFRNRVAFNFRLLAPLALLTAALLLLPLPDIHFAPDWFIPAHAFAELTAIVTSFLLFAVGWIAWNRGAPFNSLLLACVFAGVGVLDISHVMTYGGLMLFNRADPMEATISFWLAARALSALGILAAVLVPERPAFRVDRFMLMAAVIVYVALCHWLILSGSTWLPDNFSTDQGLTPFKKSAEFSFALIHLLSAAILWRHMKRPSPYHLPALWAAVLIMAMGALLFTQYRNLTDLHMALGHVYKVIAHLLLFRAVFVETVDVPYRRARTSERRLSRLLAEQRLAAVAFESQVAIMVTDAGQRILRVNRMFSTITGYRPEEVVGRTPRILSSGLQSRNFYQQMWEQLHRNDRWEGEMWNRRKNGEAYPEHLMISVVRDDSGGIEYYVANFGDLTNAKNAEERIHTLAYYDPLTQLPNRRMLRDHVRKVQTAREGSRSHRALFFIDLDNFRALNDSHGHVTGDLALKRAAERLMTCTREADIVARPGGDEFAILLDTLQGSGEQVAKAAQEVAHKVLERLRKPYYLDGSSWSVSASIGIVLFQGDTGDPDELIARAEIAMYEAKRSGGDTWRFFDPQMQKEAQRRSRFEEDLREAVDADQLRLFFQVQVDRGGSVIGCEGLLRWEHPERGLVPPDQFIPVAEQNGLIIPLGRWVIEKACGLLQQWSQDPVRRHWSLAVNISGRQLAHPGFVDETRAVLLRYGICEPDDSGTGLRPVGAGRLEFEITESLLLEDLDNSVEVIRSLSALGIVFAMDDFGTGYSSLSYLKMLPLQLVKVDRSFVSEMLENRGDAAIVEMVIALAKTLDLKVVAEGVESVAHHRALVDLGCDYLQGYLYGRPVAAEHLPVNPTIGTVDLGSCARTGMADAV